MRFGKSSSNSALLRGDVRRCWPVPFVYAAIWVIALPLRLNAQGVYHGEDLLRMRTSTVLDTMESAAILAFFFGCAMAMALMGYLMNARATGLMHSLPITRRRQFFIHFAGGFGMFTAANALVFVLSVLVTLGGGVPWAALGWWLLVTELMGLFFLSVGFLSAILTGWLLAVPVVYLAIQFGVWVITMLLRALGRIFYWGYAYGSLPPAVEWLTPVVKLCRSMENREMYTPASYADYVAKGSQINTDALPVVLIYAAAGLLLLALGSLLYRIRRSEAAGDAVAHSGLRPVVRAVGALVGGLALGLMVYEILDGEKGPIVTVYVVVMTALCYFTVEMLLKKSFRVFAAGWLRALAVCAVAAAVCVCVSLDLTGYQTRVPDADAVRAVEDVMGPRYYGNKLMEEETIQAVTALHQAIVTEGEGEATDPWHSFSFTYEMKNGATVNRQYGVYVKRNGAIHKAANRLLNCPEVQWKQILGGKGGHIARGETPAFRGGYVIVYNSEAQTVQISAQQAQALFAALAADVLAGRNTHDLLDDGTEYLQVEIELESADGEHDIYLWTRETRLEKTCTDTLTVLLGLGFTEKELIGNELW